MLPTNILGRSTHGRLHSLPRSIHEELGEPLENLLYLLRVRLQQVLGRELDTDVADTSCDFSIGLIASVSYGMMYTVAIEKYQAHAVAVVRLLLLAPPAIVLALGPELLAHSSVVEVHVLREKETQWRAFKAKMKLPDAS